MYMCVCVCVCEMITFVANGIQFLNDAVCISLNANTSGKAINPTILPPAMGRY